MSTSLRKLKDYKSETSPTWCPGCGDFGILSAVQRAALALELEDLYLPEEQVDIRATIINPAESPGGLVARLEPIDPAGAATTLDMVETADGWIIQLRD